MLNGYQWEKFGTEFTCETVVSRNGVNVEAEESSFLEAFNQETNSEDMAGWKRLKRVL
jgi:hypothetical protein